MVATGLKGMRFVRSQAHDTLGAGVFLGQSRRNTGARFLGRSGGGILRDGQRARGASFKHSLLSFQFFNFLRKKQRIHEMDPFGIGMVFLPVWVGQLQCIQLLKVWVRSVASVHFLLLLHFLNLATKYIGIVEMRLLREFLVFLPAWV